MLVKFVKNKIVKLILAVINKMRKINCYKRVMLVGATGLLLGACTKNPDSPGLEFMPDMYRSAAIEAYVDYGVVAGNEVDSLTMRMSARMPVEGTIAFSTDTSKAKFNYPFEYLSPEQDPTAYELAAKNLKNPIAYSIEVETQGKELYGKFCAQCHGTTGQGDGKVVEWGNFPSPGAYDKKYKETTEGQMFYTMTYGKGLMGSHASQLSKEERWKIVHYVRTLQNSGTNPLAKQ
jgi:mono/diheme cytochrome c family protein